MPGTISIIASNGRRGACLLPEQKPDDRARAEELAREVARRWEPWGGPRDPELTWVVAPLPVLLPRILEANEETIAGHAADRIGAALGAAPYVAAGDRGYGSRRPVPSRVSRHPLGLVLASALDDARNWQEASAKRLAIPGQYRLDTTFDAMPDPFEPLLDLWTLGYALGVPDEDDKLELFAATPPAPDRPEVLAASLRYLVEDLERGFPAPLDWLTQCAPDRESRRGAGKGMGGRAEPPGAPAHACPHGFPARPSARRDFTA